MTARQADRLMQDKVAEEAHGRWEAERKRRVGMARQQELHRWKTVAHLRQKREMQKVCGLLFEIFAPVLLVLVLESMILDLCS